jgi:hypothetical protein
MAHPSAHIGSRSHQIGLCTRHGITSENPKLGITAAQRCVNLSQKRPTPPTRGLCCWVKSADAEQSTTTTGRSHRTGRPPSVGSSGLPLSSFLSSLLMAAQVLPTLSSCKAPAQMTQTARWRRMHHVVAAFWRLTSPMTATWSRRCRPFAARITHHHTPNAHIDAWR